jgi:hypothetical protein
MLVRELRGRVALEDTGKRWASVSSVSVDGNPSPGRHGLKQPVAHEEFGIVGISDLLYIFKKTKFTNI